MARSNQPKKTNIDVTSFIAEAIAQGPVDQPNKCKFCGKGFIKPSSLSAHLCEKKRRHQQKNEQGVRYGFNAWLKFYEYNQGTLKSKTYDDFVASAYYTGFVKFGRYIHSINAINPTQFIEWILRSNIKLEKWATDKVYNDYLFSYLRNESAESALERGVLAMQGWAEQNDSEVHHFFRYASTNRVVAMISNGSISPWVIYCCVTGKNCISKLNSEQLEMVWPWIDPDYWNSRLKKYKDDTDWCSSVLTQSGF